MKKIFVVTSNRADYGLMSNLIYLLKKEKTISLKLIVTGSHLEKKYGYTLKSGVNIPQRPIINETIPIINKYTLKKKKEDHADLIWISSYIYLSFTTTFINLNTGRQHTRMNN